MFNLKFLCFTLLLLISIVLGEEISYRHHYTDGKECEVKDGQLIENGIVRYLTPFEIKKLKKYEHDLNIYNEFRIFNPFRNIQDLFNYRSGFDRPELPCFCSFCTENSDNVRTQVTRIDFEKPNYRRRLGQNEYEDSFPTPGPLEVLDNNNNYENNYPTKSFDLRSSTSFDVCIVQDDVIIDGSKHRAYTDEDRIKIKQYDEEVYQMIDELKEKLIKLFDTQIYKPDIHENIIGIVKEHSKSMPEFPCVCDSCKQDDEEDKNTELTDQKIPTTSRTKTNETKGKAGEIEKDISKEENEEKVVSSSEKTESTKNSGGTPVIPSKETPLNS
uniref:Fam-b protein n=1 Tax=Strongyloides papillosus TaxID=174720 RepID=A0A0N5BXA7_STREA